MDEQMVELKDLITAGRDDWRRRRRNFAGRLVLLRLDGGR